MKIVRRKVSLKFDHNLKNMYAPQYAGNCKNLGGGSE